MSFGEAAWTRSTIFQNSSMVMTAMEDSCKFVKFVSSRCVSSFCFHFGAPVLRNGPNAELSEKSREGGGQVVGVEATGIRKHPGVAAAKHGLLEADTSVFDTGDDAVGVNADKRDDRRAPASDFRLQAATTCAKFVVRQFIRAGGGALDD